MSEPQDNFRIYIKNAHKMLEVARLNLDNSYYGSACNRAYYAIFYAANALLFARNISFGKHSAVIAAFRQQFVKTGQFDAKWSTIYQRVMAHRQSADYDINL